MGSSRESFSLFINPMKQIAERESTISAQSAALQRAEEALDLVDENFNRDQKSGNFLGDDDLEAWGKVLEALAEIRSLKTRRTNED